MTFILLVFLCVNISFISNLLIHVHVNSSPSLHLRKRMIITSGNMETVLLHIWGKYIYTSHLHAQMVIARKTCIETTSTNFLTICSALRKWCLETSNTFKKTSGQGYIVPWWND